MSDALRTAISGLTDSAFRIANATSNIVNASSTGAFLSTGGNTAYAPRDVVTLSNAVGGVTSHVTPRDTPARAVADPQSPDANSDGVIAAPNVDLIAETLALKIAQTTYAASAKVIQAVEDTDKKLIDTVA